MKGKKITITINREDKKQLKLKEEEKKVIKETNLETKEQPDNLSGEELYAKEIGIVLDEYIKFTQAYKKVSKMMMNPFKMKKQAGAIYKELDNLSKRFNEVIHTFKGRAVVPTEDLQPIHEKLLDSLSYFEVYNNEFPELMRNGNFKRLHEVSQGLDKGNKGLKEVFDLLEEREKNKDK